MHVLNIDAIGVCSLCCGVFLISLILLRRWRSKAPKVLGGHAMQDILKRIEVLCEPQLTPGLYCSGDIAIVVQALETQWNSMRCPFTFQREYVSVDIDGSYEDRVAVAWLERPDILPDDAPIVVIIPGLCCDEANLPGISVYPELIKRKCRVGVFLKRGVAQLLEAPALHFFGHPSDLQAVIDLITDRYPQAGIHVVSFSSGNGLAGSHSILTPRDKLAVKSYLIMFGGSDYNALCRNSCSSRMCSSWLVVDVVLARAAKEFFLVPNRRVLEQHNAGGYRAAMQSRNFQELHNAVMGTFSGYSNLAEADVRTNGFSNGAQGFGSVHVPCLWVTCADDPILPGGPNESWCDHLKESDFVALAVFRRGSHGAAYESLRLAHWSDRLLGQWLDAVFDAELQTPSEQEGESKGVAVNNNANAAAGA
eukprot:gnl/TRDRNA2_/TRDRNA2_177685_c1_seq21.p1 gnl/TRDRNA2_/TRDRNA2_177685_c1~~gnl/TRDRNA2_/TRDRNA2_177685_c1_seq21.p1  ORF type:complete len:422 (-),score=28.19 gnl/TRDRNA2_/TRDRNA2_177685_c1_seq21:21-1286(-)